VAHPKSAATSYDMTSRRYRWRCGWRCRRRQWRATAPGRPAGGRSGFTRHLWIFIQGGRRDATLCE